MDSVQSRVAKTVKSLNDILINLMGCTPSLLLLWLDWQVRMQGMGSIGVYKQ